MHTSTRQEGSNTQDVSREQDDKQRSPSSPGASAHAIGDMRQPSSDRALQEEMRKLCKENQDGHDQTIMSLERLERAVADSKGQIKHANTKRELDS